MSGRSDGLQLLKPAEYLFTGGLVRLVATYLVSSLKSFNLDCILMFLRKVIGSSRCRKDPGVQIWEDHLHLKDHLHRLRTCNFSAGENWCHTRKKKVWFIPQDLST